MPSLAVLPAARDTGSVPLPLLKHSLVEHSLVEHRPVDIVMGHDEAGSSGLDFHRGSEEATTNVQVGVHRRTILLAEATRVSVGRRSTAELDQAGDGIGGDVLPMAITAYHDHPVQSRQPTTYLSTLVGEPGVRVVVVLAGCSLFACLGELG